MSHLNGTRKDREHKKILLHFHSAFSEIINQLEEMDFQKYSVKTNTAGPFASNVLSSYDSYLNRCSFILGQEESELSLFDKTICFGMSLKENKAVGAYKINSKSPKRVQSLNDRLVVRAMMHFLESSTYRLATKGDHTVFSGAFSYDGFDDGHKKELKTLEKLLLEAVSPTQLDYNACLATLQKIYIRGVIYQEEVDTIDELQLLASLKIRENQKVSYSPAPLSEAYQNYTKAKRY